MREIVQPAIVRPVEDDLADLAKAAKAELEAEAVAVRQSVEHARRAGEVLKRAWDRLAPERKWLAWLQENGIPQQRASERIRIFDNWSRIPPEVGGNGVAAVLAYLRTDNTEKDDAADEPAEARPPETRTVDPNGWCELAASVLREARVEAAAEIAAISSGIEATKSPDEAAALADRARRVVESMDRLSRRIRDTTADLVRQIDGWQDPDARTLRLASEFLVVAWAQLDEREFLRWVRFQFDWDRDTIFQCRGLMRKVARRLREQTG